MKNDISLEEQLKSLLEKGKKDGVLVRKELDFLENLNPEQEMLERFRKGSRFLPYCTGKEKLQVSLVSRSPALYNRLFQNRARRALKQKLGLSAQTP